MSEPCPFCGGQAKPSYILDGRVMLCQSCYAAGPPKFHGKKGMAPAEDRALAAWNRRASTTGGGRAQP